MKFIELTQGKRAMVDNEDYEWLSQWKWHAHSHKTSNTYYAVRSINYRTPTNQRKCSKIFMHRLLLGLTKSEQFSDHRNRNGLDNRRQNLREATPQQNAANKGKYPGSSTFKGVYWNKTVKKWRAKIVNRGTFTHIGHFSDEIEAAKAYDKTAHILFGEFAATNKSLGLL